MNLTSTIHFIYLLYVALIVMAEPQQPPSSTSSSHSTTVRIAKTAQEALVETLKYLNEAEIKHGNYSVLRHTRPFVLYQGANTIVPISVFGPEPLPKDRRVFLQRRGYRTGLLGWTFGGWLGGSKLPGIDVTPVSAESWSRPQTLTSKQQTQIDKDISRLFKSPDAPRPPETSKSRLLETLLVHVPVRSGDGYFRLRITSSNGRKTIAESPVFRVGSLTWSSAHPQGATPLGLIPEVGARSLFLTGQTAAWAAFYAAFPFLKISQMVPGLGPWSHRMLQWAYTAAGGDVKRQELDERFGVSKNLQKANERMYKEIPFGAAGIRTAADLIADDQAGPGVSHRAYGGATTCCDKLRAKTSGAQVLGPISLNYVPENLKYWSSSCILTPQCIFTPTSSSDVSAALKVLVQNNCEFAIRSGGHTANPGWAGTSSGVLISLSKLNTIRVSEDTTSVVVGAGNRWGDVYAETGKHGVTVPGGRISPVGVGGFLLGGGLSYLMHNVGFAANSVLSYEIVLANGTIANVTNTFGSDLFKALKGGTGNFGIVTAFQLQTYPVDKVYAGSLYYGPAQFDSLFPLMEAYARDGTESDPKSHVISAFVNSPGKLLNLATFYAFHSDPVTTPPPAIKPFAEVPTLVNTLGVKTVKGAADELTVGTINGARENMHAYAIRANAALYKELFDLWQSTTSSLNSISGWLSAMAFQPVSNSMIRASNERGGNVLGLEPMNDPLIIVHYQSTWLLATDDEKVYATIDKLVAESKAIAQSQGRLADYIYLNYASTGQPVIESYGPAQVAFLRDVKAKYDPNNVFKKLSPGGFKIPA